MAHSWFGFLGRRTRLWLMMACMALSPWALGSTSHVSTSNGSTSEEKTPAILVEPVVEAAKKPQALENPETPIVKDTASQDLASQGFKTLASLVLMIGVLLGVAWFVRKNGRMSLLRTSEISIQSFLNLGNKEKIALLKVKDKEILVGMTSSQIQTLYVFDAGDSNQTPVSESKDGSDES